VKLGLALLVACLASTGCIQLRFTRDAGDEPMTAGDTAVLRPGESRLDECLARLGAPNLVWWTENGETACAYKWVDETSWRVIGFYILVAGYEDEDLDVPASVLRFDDHQVLIDVREGRLRDLAQELEDREHDTPGHHGL
jgi:hypothetical protein